MKCIRTDGWKQFAVLRIDDRFGQLAQFDALASSAGRQLQLSGEAIRIHKFDVRRQVTGAG